MKNIVLLLCLLVNLGVLAQYEKSVDFSELSKTLQQDFAKNFDFSALVEMDDTRVFYEHFGYIDKERSRAVNEKTLFNIASISKSITAVGIMKLVEQNKINLYDTLGLFFENVPRSKASISIRTLLSHKSGLQQTYPVDGISDSAEALEVIMKGRLQFAPDSGFRYSNQNYQLLALIIEKVTQTTFEIFIEQNVLSPLNMNDTYFWHEMNEQKNVAWFNETVSGSLGKRNWGYIGATGIFTTTTDLNKFWNGIYKQEFLSKESMSIIFDSYYQTSSGIQIGLGFFTSPNTKWNTPELWTRGTESWGHNSVIRFFPEKNVTIIVSTNSGEIDNNSSMTGNRIISELIADHVFE